MIGGVVAEPYLNEFLLGGAPRWFANDGDCDYYLMLCDLGGGVANDAGAEGDADCCEEIVAAVAVAGA